MVEQTLRKEVLAKADLAALLAATQAEEVEAIRRAAEDVLRRHCGNAVYLRGLIEFSNLCVHDCYYCGIRSGNRRAHRYTLTMEEVLEAACGCARGGYGSIVLQSGERRDEGFLSFVEQAVRAIKRETVCEQLPRGLGITLCVGEQSPQAYERFFAAGAHRYLLRIETSSPHLFARIHPPGQKWETRLACLHTLREIGFQVGTGVMIGLPGQTAEDLADDILFFREQDVDMIGMGPYLPHRHTPMAVHEADVRGRWGDLYRSSLLMIAATRLVLKDVNIAATTALQAMKHTGREEGLTYGANVLMPQVTPERVRRDYLLYEGKPCLDGSLGWHTRLENRIRALGRTIGYNAWGDSPRARARGRAISLDRG